MPVIKTLALGLVFLSTTILAGQIGPDDVGGSGRATGEVPAGPAAAANIVVSSGFDGTEPTQDGRINRNGIASTCANAKTYPGPFNTGIPYQYKTYSLVNGASTCVTVNWEPNPGSGNDCDFTAHLSAYLDSYDPANQSANYLGDVGSSQTQPFSFNAPAGATVILVATINSGSNVVCDFDFSSDHLSDTPAFSNIPVPSMNVWGLGTMVMVLGLAGFAARRRRVL